MSRASVPRPRLPADPGGQDKPQERSREETLSPSKCAGGYGFHSVWRGLVEYVNELDIDKIK